MSAQPTSRLCVKNIPKHIKEDRLRQHFAQRGEVTDVKIMKTADGRSRLFGFIGFRTEKEAKGAMNYFNNTFIDTSKISVEMARPLGDNALPRPWSKYSKGSSRFEQIEQRKKDQEEKKEEAAERKKEALERKRKWKDILEVKEELAKEDPHLLTDFLSSTKSRASADGRKVWANDLLLPTPSEAPAKPVVKQVKKRKLDEGEVVKEVTLAVRNKKPGGEGQVLKKTHLKFDDSDGSDSDDMYEDMPSAAQTATAAQTSSATAAGGALPTMSVRDLMRLGDNGDDDDDEDEDDEENGAGEDGADEDEGEEEEEEEDEMEKEEESEKKKEEEKEGVEEKQEKEEGKEKENEGEEGEDDPARLYLRNLPYSTTEDELHKLFKKHGDVSEVHMPIDRETKKPRGFAYVTFMLPENAAKALTALDGSIFQGRVLHVMPAKVAPVSQPPEKDADGTPASSFRQKKEQKLKESSSSSHNWNPFYMKSDAVLDAVAANLGVTKQEILNPEDGNMSTRVAIAETRIIAETKAYLKSEGINLEGITAIMAADAKVERSRNMILVKNIPYQTKLEDLRDMFAKFGSISRVILPPTRTMALIEYLEPSEARRGFKHLAYTRFHHVPLYLEWAPLAIIGQKPERAGDNDDDDAEEEEETTTTTTTTTVTDKKKLLEAEEMERLEGTTLFVKNLNFKSTEEGMRSIFEQVAPVRSVTVAKKKDLKNGGQLRSLGYGFVEFVKRDGALKAIKQLQGKMLDNHALQLSFAQGGRKAADSKKQGEQRKNQASLAAKPTCTILVKNVAFEATKAEIRELFATFGQLKSVRMPKKMDGRTRGFAFVDFITKQEAKNAYQSLQDTHLYGRHLVLEFVQNSTASAQAARTNTEQDS